MEHRQLGQSDIKTSVIVFGAWAIGGAMWGGTDEAKAIEAIRTSIDEGVNAIDTAPLYGFGKSEEFVAKAIAGRRDKVYIFDKYGLRADVEEGEFHFTMDYMGRPMKIYKNARAKRIFEEIDRSLKLLQTDYIDLYQCHWRDTTTPIEETMSAMDKLLKQGKIRAAGVSNFSSQEIEEANSFVPLAAVQPPYSMVNRGIEQDVLPACRRLKIGVIVYSPLQRGLLTGKFKPDHKFAPHDHRAANVFFRPQNISHVNAMLRQFAPIAEQHNATIAQVVLNWTIQQPGVTAALVGARDGRQARQNAQAGNFTLAQQEMDDINGLLSELQLQTA